MIRFTVPGDPLPAERPRVVQRGPRRVALTPQRTLDAEARVAQAFREAYPDHRTDTVAEWALEVTFYRETRRAADIDNLAKVTLDGMTLAAVWADDRQVALIHARRHMGVGKGNGSTVVVARPLGRPPGESATLDLPDTTTPNGATTP